MNTVKDDAKKIIESLPEHGTWDYLTCQLYVKKKLKRP
jgi:hypothetical protein